MNDVITRWFSRIDRLHGVAAFGLNCGEANYSNSWHAQLPEANLDSFWPRLSNIASRVMRDTTQADGWRWTFPGYVIEAARRNDGATFFVVRERNGSADDQSILRLFSEFRALRGSAE